MSLSQLTFIFFRGVGLTTNQLYYISMVQYFQDDPYIHIYRKLIWIYIYIYINYTNIWIIPLNIWISIWLSHYKYPMGSFLPKMHPISPPNQHEDNGCIKGGNGDALAANLLEVPAMPWQWQWQCWLTLRTRQHVKKGLRWFSISVSFFFFLWCCVNIGFMIILYIYIYCWQQCLNLLFSDTVEDGVLKVVQHVFFFLGN